MLLNSLYDLGQRHDLLEGLYIQTRKLHMVIPISKEGEVIGIGLIAHYSQDKKGKFVLGRETPLPRFPGENNGGKAYFLAESCEYVLGLDTITQRGLHIGAQKLDNKAKSFLHYWEQIEIAERETNLPELMALLRFRDLYLNESEGCTTHNLPFLQTRELKQGKKALQKHICAGLSGAGNDWTPLKKEHTISFQVDNQFIFKSDPNDPLNQYWKNTFKSKFFADENQLKVKKSLQGFCMITQDPKAIIALSHKPKILSIPNLSSGGYLVSFARDCPAFSSYGFDTGKNAPVSEKAAAAYTLSLEKLLRSENNSVRIGPSVVCFWTKEKSEAINMLADLMNNADPKTVSDFLRNPWSGIDQKLAKKDQFYCATFSGNAGRVVLRHWMQISLKQALINFKQWFDDLSMVNPSDDNGHQSLKGPAMNRPSPDKDKQTNVKPLSVFALARTTVRDPKDLRNAVVSQLYRAALEGTSPSLILVKLILKELKSALVSDSAKERRYPYSLSRFALLKLILNRNLKGDDPMIEPQVFETQDAAYNCGRLLAVLAAAQERAHGFQLEGAGVVERYFGSASVSPSSAFPLLLRLNRHHLEKIRKSENNKNLAGLIEKDIQNIMTHLIAPGPSQPPEFPRYLDLKQQGRFAIGFYQQKAGTQARIQKAIEDKKQKESNTEEVSE